MTYDQLDQLEIDHKWLAPLEAVFARYDISTKQRQASFVGQCQHESNNFRTLEENLHYSAARLMVVWSSRFPNADVAGQYANNPEKIANKVYAGRMGNTEEGDGWKFRGRGVIQLTGKDAYLHCGSSLRIDIIANPDLLLEPMNACLSAGWFWGKRGLNDLADEKNYEEMTRRINGGLNGFDDRKKRILKAIFVLG